MSAKSLSFEKTFLVTGGGFIGSNFVHHMLENTVATIVNLDALTYAGNPQNLQALQSNASHIFVHDITNAALLEELFARHPPRAMVHFAAESHVDRLANMDWVAAVTSGEYQQWIAVNYAGRA